MCGVGFSLGGKELIVIGVGAVVLSPLILVGASRTMMLSAHLLCDILRAHPVAAPSTTKHSSTYPVDFLSVFIVLLLSFENLSAPILPSVHLGRRRLRSKNSFPFRSSRSLHC